MLIADNLHKTYRQDTPTRSASCAALDLDVDEGEFLSIVGASGSGKSTMLHLLGTLDEPDQGSIPRRRAHRQSAGPRARSAAQPTFGFIFQFYHLLPELNTLENVLMPQMIAHSVLELVRQRREARKQATEMLERVGLGHRLKHKPRELSGGEMQRAAIARALIDRAARPARRRADRQSRRRHRRRHRRAVARLEPPGGPDYHHGHAQHGTRRRDRSRGAAGRRPSGRTRRAASPHAGQVSVDRTANSRWR